MESDHPKLDFICRYFKISILDPSSPSRGCVDAGSGLAEARNAQGYKRGTAPREHPNHGRCLYADHRGQYACDEFPDHGDFLRQETSDSVRSKSDAGGVWNPEEEEKILGGECITVPTWTTAQEGGYL
jgi:hypothetical protein